MQAKKLKIHFTERLDELMNWFHLSKYISENKFLHLKCSCCPRPLAFFCFFFRIQPFHHFHLLLTHVRIVINKRMWLVYSFKHSGSHRISYSSKFLLLGLLHQKKEKSTDFNSWENMAGWNIVSLRASGYFAKWASQCLEELGALSSALCDIAKFRFPGLYLFAGCRMDF